MSSLRVNFYDWMKAQKVSSSSLLSSLSSSRTSVCHQSKKTRSFSPCILLQHPNNGYALPGQKSLQGTLGSHRFPPERKPLKRVSWPHAFLLLMPPFLGTTSTHTTFFTISGEPTHGQLSSEILIHGEEMRFCAPIYAGTYKWWCIEAQKESL